MNWTLLKRSSLSNRPCPTNGLCTVTEETDLDYAFLRLQKLEETSRYLRKEVKALSDSVTSVSRGEQKLTSDLSSCHLVMEDEKLRGLVEDYHSVSKQMIDAAKVFAENMEKTVGDPLKQYLNEFSNVQAAVRKRDMIVNEIMPAKNRLMKHKERERTGANVAKAEQLRRTVSSMEDEFKATNKQLLNDMNAMLDLRSDYIEPSLVASVRTQIDYYGQCTRLFTSLIQAGNSPRANAAAATSGRAEPPPAELAALFQNDIKAIRSLSIVAQSN